MAAVDLDSAINETREILQPLFAKPKLSTKLLSKPPFRFIHDIVVATLKATGFPNGFFSLEELDSSKVKDSKSAKISFLNKLIHLVNVGNGSALKVASSKIVAGLEPSRTNVLLSAFGRLAQDEAIDRRKLIRHCLAGKGIDEFRDRLQSEASDALDKGSGTDSPASDEQKGAVGRVVSVAKQIQACNEELGRTKAMISSIVAKPKCTDKLLGKPPFRFIHDLITGIGRATRFDLGQIFSEDELISSNVKEKQSKLRFLEKLIGFLEIRTEASVRVKPAKIISGLEPERTRYLLQLFAVVASNSAPPPPEETLKQGNEKKEQATIEGEAKESAGEETKGDEDEEIVPPTPREDGRERRDRDAISVTENIIEKEAPVEAEVEREAIREAPEYSLSTENACNAAALLPDESTAGPPHQPSISERPVSAAALLQVDSAARPPQPSISERPVTARFSERPPALEEKQAEPLDAIDAIRHDGKLEEKTPRVRPSFAESSTEEKVDDLSIFQKIVQEQKEE